MPFGEAYRVHPVNEGWNPGEDCGFRHLVAHAGGSVTDDTMDSPDSTSQAVQGASRVALTATEERTHAHCLKWSLNIYFQIFQNHIRIAFRTVFSVRGSLIWSHPLRRTASSPEQCCPTTQVWSRLRAPPRLWEPLVVCPGWFLHLSW